MVAGIFTGMGWTYDVVHESIEKFPSCCGGWDLHKYASTYNVVHENSCT